MIFQLEIRGSLTEWSRLEGIKAKRRKTRVGCNYSTSRPDVHDCEASDLTKWTTKSQFLHTVCR